jgi:hypothetical protein
MDMSARLLFALSFGMLSWGGVCAAQEHELKGGYPTPETAQEAYDEADLNRAVHAYRFFYPTVSSAAIFNEMIRLGQRPNQVFGFMNTQPRHVGFTLNSDTPYGGILPDLSVGPLVVELPPGPLLGAGLDINQRWIMTWAFPARTPARAAGTCCCRRATPARFPPATTSAGRPPTA